MSTIEVANKLVALCREGKNTEAIESLYSSDIVSVEAAEMPGFGRTQTGMEAIMGKAKWWAENNEVHSQEVAGPFAHGDDKFAVVFKMDVTMKPTNQRINLEEVAVYTVENDKIVREEFYYTMGG